MKIARLQNGNDIFYAEKIKDKYFLLSGDIENGFKRLQKEVNGKILPPVIPSKIVALGANYFKHITELNRNELMQKVVETKKEPLLFLKPSSAIIGTNENIVLPNESDNIHYEGEIAIIMGKNCKNISKDEALSYVFGYTLANDVSDRTLQNLDVQWTRAKGFDTFCPLGDLIDTEMDIFDAKIKTYLNGKIVQDGNSKDMITKIDEIIAFVSKVMTLKVGDVIITGTPEGVGKLSENDEIIITLNDSVKLTNKVVLAK